MRVFSRITQAIVGIKRHRAGAAVAPSVLLIVEECRARVSVLAPSYSFGAELHENTEGAEARAGPVIVAGPAAVAKPVFMARSRKAGCCGLALQLYREVRAKVLARTVPPDMNDDGSMRLQHISVAIDADGGDAARAFYRELLGLEEKPVPPKLDPGQLVWFRAGGDLELHLLRTGDAPPLNAHFCLAVDSGLEELRARLEAAGVETSTPTEIVGRPRFMCRDPFGNLIELTELPAQQKT